MYSHCVMDAAIIENNAMKLDGFQRALLADRLLKSIISVPDQLHEVWVQEASARIKAYESGDIESLDGPQAMNELKMRYIK